MVVQTAEQKVLSLVVTRDAKSAVKMALHLVSMMAGQKAQRKVGKTVESKALPMAAERVVGMDSLKVEPRV